MKKTEPRRQIEPYLRYSNDQPATVGWQVVVFATFGEKKTGFSIKLNVRPIITCGWFMRRQKFFGQIPDGIFVLGRQTEVEHKLAARQSPEPPVRVVTLLES